MIIGIIYFGWKYGFQHYCISYTVAIFFCDFYLNKERKVGSRRFIYMSISNMLLYCELRLWTYYFPCVYEPGSPIIPATIFIINGMMTFFFVMFYLNMYSNTVIKLENELRHMADRDSLTGLWNRRKMLQILGNNIESGKEDEFAVAMLDVDFFKNVNGTCGHDAGDAILKTVEDVLISYNLGENKYVVSRWSGEEFLSLYIHGRSGEEIIEEFESLRKTFENLSIFYKDITIRITITIGLAFYHKGGSLEKLLKEVDTLLYNGNEAGRNRFTHTKE